MSKAFRQLVTKANGKAFTGVVISLDPGETTGMCIMHDLDIVRADQLVTKDLTQGFEEINSLFHSVVHDYPQEIRVVCEDYRVYGWKSDQHKWADLHTPKLIGVIHALVNIYELPVAYQMAIEAKQFCTDDKLTAWDFYQKGQRHARDAIRHACYYTLFKTGETNSWQN